MAPRKEDHPPKKRRKLKENKTNGITSATESLSEFIKPNAEVKNALTSWLVGDLAWSKVKGHPWWPSMICYAPGTTIYFKTANGPSTIQYHVQYFGDKPIRGWVKLKDMILFKGKSLFLSDQKLPSKGYLKTWEPAVTYAEEALKLERHQRIQEYGVTFKFEASMKKEKAEIKPVNNELNETLNSCNSEKSLQADENGNVTETYNGKRKRKQKTNIDFHFGSDFDMATGRMRNGTKSLKKERKFKGKVETALAVEAESTASLPEEISNTKKVVKQKRKTEFNNGIEPLKSTAGGICILCEENNNVVQCLGGCFNFYHLSCLGLSSINKTSTFKCDRCTSNNHNCFSCQKNHGEIKKCSCHRCGKYYHAECLKQYKTDDKTNDNGDNNKMCPLHSCNYCLSTKSKVTVKSKLIYCIRCPTAYHLHSCLVAGAMVLSSQFMICEKHFVVDKSILHHSPVHVSWCFRCSKGGTLICCDTCPVAFHAECIENFDSTTEKEWQCIGCEDGKKPLYNDIVWVKYGCWRWWPAKICHPDTIPERIMHLKHSLGEFPVMFFGSHDYCWLHSRRVFAYQDGDSGVSHARSTTIKSQFTKALVEAKEAYIALREEKQKRQEVLLAKKPPSYKHLKSNRYVSAVRSILEPSNLPVCECSENDETPCGPNSSCLNRTTQFACSMKTCPAKDKCQNQFFQKNIYAKCTPFRSVSCGWGLKSQCDIKKGQFVIEYQGELVNEKTCKERIQTYHDEGISDYYFLVIDRDCIIDAYPKGNLSRFMNHSCDPNCDTQKWTVNGEIRVGLFANKDIANGDDLTFNYNLDCLGNQKKQCMCGSKNCSGFLGARPKSITLPQKPDKKKKKKRKLKLQPKHEDDCFICGNGGELMLCDNKNCAKCYHMTCLSLLKQPKGKWLCPWHYCDECGKKATSLCQLCPNSYCGLHQEGELKLVDGVKVCLAHSNEEINDYGSEITTVIPLQAEQ